MGLRCGLRGWVIWGCRARVRGRVGGRGSDRSARGRQRRNPCLLCPGSFQSPARVGVGVRARARVAARVRFGFGSGRRAKGEKNTRPNPNPSQPPLTCSRSRGSDETCTACPMKLALRMAARVCRVRMYGEWKKRTVSLPGAPHGHGSTYTRHAVRTARLSLVRVRRRVQYVEPRGRLPCA